MFIRIIIFLILNFTALAIGGLFTGPGVPSEWYQNLIKAPWTPPGWMFGLAWSLIMLCFTIYMAYVWDKVDNRIVLTGLFILQIILNISWNPLFFKYHLVFIALAVIISLTILIIFFFVFYFNHIRWWSVLVLPYIIWLVIASSLNLYIYIEN